MSYDSAQAHDKELDRIRALEQRVTQLEGEKEDLKRRLHASDDENEAQAEERFWQADRITKGGLPCQDGYDAAQRLGHGSRRIVGQREAA